MFAEKMQKKNFDLILIKVLFFKINLLVLYYFNITAILFCHLLCNSVHGIVILP